MFKMIYIKSELKKIIREPMMALLLFVPLIIPVIFRLLVTFLVPFIGKYVEFDFSLYNHYVLSFVLMLSPMLLSMIVGFSMIDDRDNRMVELISVTPFSKSGYVVLRLAMLATLVLFYSLYSYFVLGIYVISVWTVLYLSVILSLYSAIMGLLLFTVASDKVKALTYAKGLNIIFLFAFVDLLNIPWMNVLGGFFPPYWITQIIALPKDIFTLTMGCAVSAVWFVFFLAKTKI